MSIDLAATAASLKVALEIGKFVIDAPANLAAAELKGKLAVMISAVADAKISLSQIQDELHEKDKEIRQLKNAFEQKGNLVRKWDAYYRRDGDGKATGAAYCAYCFDNEQKIRALSSHPTNNDLRKCVTCKTEFIRYGTEDIS